MDWLILGIGAALYIWIQVVFANAHRHDNDFKHIYLGMQALTEREEPYSAASLLLQAGEHGMRNASLNPYVYLPFTGLSLAFLKPLPFPAAAQVWFVLNHLLAIGALWLIAITLFPTRRILAFGCLIATATLNHPFLRTLTAGQLNMVLLFCYASAFALLARGRDSGAGWVLGFAAMFKIAPALFALYFLLQRRWRALACMVAICAILMGISIAGVGWRIHADFLPMLKQMSYGHSSWEQHNAVFWKDPANQSLNSLATHLLVSHNNITTPWIASTQSAANAATIALTLALALVFLVRSASRNFPNKDFGIQQQALFHATIILSLLVPSLMWDHYLVLLLLSAAWLAKHLFVEKRYGLLGLVVISWALISIPWQYDGESFLHGPGVPLMSMKLFPTIAFFILLCMASRDTADKVRMETT